MTEACLLSGIFGVDDADSSFSSPHTKKQAVDANASDALQPAQSIVLRSFAAILLGLTFFIVLRRTSETLRFKAAC